MLRIDLIKIRISATPETYWKPRTENKINFEEQF